jgi:hypothetical protein
MNLTMFHHEHLVLILKHKNTSWLVMSSVRKYQTPLTYVLKNSWLIGNNKGNERDKSLIAEANFSLFLDQGSTLHPP